MKTHKKLVSLIAAASMCASMAVPAVTASADEMKSWKFDFGATAADGWTQVTAADAYSDDKGYGFLGQDSTVYKAVVDGYNQTADDKTELKNGGTGSDAYHDYVYTEDDHMPIRFAVKTENNTYYKIKVTMGYSDKDSDIWLTSERRHFILTDEKITAGNKIEKTFTAAVHSVQWKDRTGGGQPVYKDDMINICVHGKNAMINAVEIQQVAKPKVVWIFGDSTTTDAASGTPWFGYNTYTGWGAGVAKFLPEDIAVVNLAEGGLAINNQSYFDVGKNDMSAGDILMLPMGHNGTAPNAENLKYYYDAITNAGGTFVACAPIERLSSASTQGFVDIFKSFAEANNCPFVSLFQISSDMYTNMGEIGKWYTHTALWEGTAANPTKSNDASHLNDFGAEIVAKGAFEALAAQADKFPALAPFVAVQTGVPAITIPKDMMTAKGTADYVNDSTLIKPPHDGFPYPASSIDYKNVVDITSANITEKDGKTYLSSYNTVRHSDLSYITCWAAAYDADGSLAGLRMNRLEPMAAKTAEVVDLTKRTQNGATTDETTDPLEIPAGGSYKTFVWNGAFSDNSMSYMPYSEVFSGYDASEAELGDWNGTTETAEPVKTVSGGIYKALATPITSGKAMFSFKVIPANGKFDIVLSPAADGNETGGVKLSVNGTTGILSRKVKGADGKEADETVIDSLKADTERDVVLIYDLDYGTLRVNVDGVGIVDIEYPGTVTVDSITPAQFASIAFKGDQTAAVSDLRAAVLKSGPLPDKTLTLEYDADKGKVTETGSETVITEKTAAMNTNLKLTAQAAPTAEHNYVFGGWIKPDGSVFSKDVSISIYLVDDMTLKPFFYEQTGLEGVADFAAVAKDAENNDVKVMKVPSEGSTALTLDITNIKDENGNDIAEFDKTANVTWALKGTDVTGVSISGNTISIASTADVAKEEMKNITVTATCNDVSKDYTLRLHNFTNLVFSDDFEDGTAGEEFSKKWQSGNTDRYTALCNEDENGNKYLEVAAVGDGNNGMQIQQNVVSSAIDGVVKAQADIQLKQITGNEKNRETILGFADSVGWKNYACKYAVSVSRNQSSNNYKVNGIELEGDIPDDNTWVTLSAVMNYITKTADITLTSLDGTITYFNQKDVPFTDPTTANFQKIVYDTNRYNAGLKLDNVFIDHVAAAEDIPAITAAPNPLEITNLSQPSVITMTVQEGYTLINAVCADAETATAVLDAAAKTVTVTPVKQGDTSVTVTALNDSNPNIKTIITVPVSLKKNDNANLASLSLKTAGGSELIDVFDMGTTEYNVRSAKTDTALAIAKSTDHSAATAVVRYNNEIVTEDRITLDGTAEEQVITVEVTAPDETTTKTYTVNIDNSYNVAENFAAGSGSWGFATSPNSAEIGNGYLTMLTKYGGSLNYTGIAKDISDTDVTGASKLSIEYDWSSNVESGKGRDSYFALREADEKIILALYGQGNGKIRYATGYKTAEDNTKSLDYVDIENFSHDWFHVSITVDFSTHKLNGTITKRGETEPKVTFTDVTIEADSLKQMYAYDGYSAAPMFLDNVYIKVIED